MIGEHNAWRPQCRAGHLDALQGILGETKQTLVQAAPQANADHVEEVQCNLSDTVYIGSGCSSGRCRSSRGGEKQPQASHHSTGFRCLTRQMPVSRSAVRYRHCAAVVGGPCGPCTRCSDRATIAAASSSTSSEPCTATVRPDKPLDFVAELPGHSCRHGHAEGQTVTLPYTRAVTCGTFPEPSLLHADGVDCRGPEAKDDINTSALITLCH